jgi:hypothetical protein
MTIKYAELDGYEISGCAAFNKNLITFWVQEWSVNDALETRATAVAFYYADEPDSDKWAFSEVGDAAGIRGCAAYLPKKQWVYVLDDSEVYVVGGGFDDFEEKISAKKHSYFSKVKSIKSGHAFAVGSRRKVYIRVKPNQWHQLDKGLFPGGDATPLENSGFVDIDGFSETEIYACGGLGDLWVYQNSSWKNIDLGTNARLTKICCASDGNVYITTNRREIFVGREHTWHLIKQELTEDVFESMVDGTNFVLAELPGMPKMKLKAHLAVGEDVLVVAGKDEANMFDGVTWTEILKST